MQLTIFQQIVIGIVQGIAEWLPISSSGMSILVMSNLYGITNLGELLHTALFLHLGTFLAALIYFRKDVAKLFKALFNYKKSDDETQRILKFLIIATAISGTIGLALLQLLFSFESIMVLTGKTITFGIATFLLFTGVIQLGTKKSGLRKEEDLKIRDGIILGVAQGVASLPGISRSGITVSSLLVKKFDDTSALRLSFLMSLPIILFGNIFLNLNDFILTSTTIYGLLASFVFGLATIHGLMRISKKINFGWFALIFAILMLGSLFL